MLARPETLNALAAVSALMMATTLAQPEMKTVQDRVAEFGEAVRARLEPQFAKAGVPCPPQRLTLIGIKETRTLEVHAAGPDGACRFVCTYPIFGASGVLGPKLREGDLQVPEGLYRIRELNPNSLFHLSLWIDYPNRFDLTHAVAEGRENPGGEIMIHGSTRSRGCLAVGDEAAEDLFVLAALTGLENISVILAPVDFRTGATPQLPADAPAWTAELYDQIKCELDGYRLD